MDARSLTIVLPAYNEEARLGPALDELFRCADKRGSQMRPRPGLAVRVAWDLLRAPVIHRRVARRRLDG